MLGPSLLVALCGALICVPGLSAEEAASGNFCDPSLCLNGGTCMVGQFSVPFYCLCPEGFTGAICNVTDEGPCMPNPCHHNAECIVVPQRGDVFTEFFCKCPRGFAGIHCEANCLTPLGMEGGAIANSQISASSVHMGFMGMQRWAPELARLHQSGIVNAWAASNYDKHPWIQVNLLRRMWVTGVVTQGASRVASAEYVKRFKVAHSLDGHTFQFIQDPESLGDKLFEGNKDKNSIKMNLFDLPVETQYLRLVPVTCHQRCTLRFELLGCELSGCSEPLGMKDNTIPDKQITASSFYNSWGVSAWGWLPSFARLDRQGILNAWTAKTNNPSEWLQVDLGTKKRLSGIITQGARDFGTVQYVAAFKVAYSNDGKNWTEYRERGSTESKIFHGNFDNNSHKKNIFETPFEARYVRVLPVSWHNHITLRLELLGC
ncbi:PREDICTED: lactadherin [Elephantulus edwardii]|uniref:lactadherin n=1 Tax=Elephantulus edwardii TaxID=28737 RepID=UPI0003F0D5D8|nr:PREDICTED: lactadherin [Elephantulus edwardii]